MFSHVIYYYVLHVWLGLLSLLFLLSLYSIANGLDKEDKQKRILDSLSGLFFTMNLLTILKTLFV